MEQNREPYKPNNLTEARRVNLTRSPNLMHDIKKPAPTPTPAYQEPQTSAMPTNLRDYTPRKSPFGKFYALLIMGIILVLGSVGTAFYFYQKSKINIAAENTPANELDQAVLDIGKIAVLPINDTPTLFSVSDPEQLRSDAFFDKSQSGDQMLLYPRVGFAVLYRPGTKQIVNMMIFEPELETSTSTATSTATTTNQR